MARNPKTHDARVVGRNRRLGVPIHESRCGLHGMDLIPAGDGQEPTCGRCKKLLAKDAAVEVESR
jgi:hypothetical protein